VADSCEHANEISDSINGGELLDQLSDCQQPKKDSTAAVLSLDLTFLQFHFTADSQSVAK
jgi:hypothetical protein